MNVCKSDQSDSQNLNSKILLKLLKKYFQHVRLCIHSEFTLHLQCPHLKHINVIYSCFICQQKVSYDITVKISGSDVVCRCHLNKHVPLAVIDPLAVNIALASLKVPLFYHLSALM